MRCGAVLRRNRATVLDADALTVFSMRRHELIDALHPACVLTPHEGEFKKIFPELSG